MADITREHMTGAIKLINAAAVTPRLAALEKMLRAEGYDGDMLRKALGDVDSYPDWQKGAAVDAPPAPAADAPAP